MQTFKPNIFKLVKRRILVDSGIFFANLYQGFGGALG
jgi:hypothetical protein